MNMIDMSVHHTERDSDPEKQRPRTSITSTLNINTSASTNFDHISITYNKKEDTDHHRQEHPPNNPRNTSELKRHLAPLGDSVSCAILLVKHIYKALREGGRTCLLHASESTLGVCLGRGAVHSRQSASVFVLLWGSLGVTVVCVCDEG